MARILHSLNVTANGSCRHDDVVADQEHHEYALGLLRAASAVLLGRNTFNLFEAFWPQAASGGDVPRHVGEFARELEAKPKLVVSSTRLSTTWKNTTAIEGPSLHALREQLRDRTGTIVVFGSPALAASLANASLLSEIHLLVQPFLADAATWAYSGLMERKDIRLLGVDRFRSGVVLLRYRVDG